MDQQLEILINRSWIAPWADHFMAFLTNYGAWAPWLLALLVGGVIFGNFRLRAAILAAGLAIGLSDGVGVNLLKHAVPVPGQVRLNPGCVSSSWVRLLRDCRKLQGFFRSPW